MRRLTSATMLCRVLIGLDRADASGVLHVWGQGHQAAIFLHSGHVVGITLDRSAAASLHQVIASVLQMSQWEGLVLRLVQSPAVAAGSGLSVRVPARAVALKSMRAAVKRGDPARVGAHLGDAVYHLTPVGEALLVGATLRPEEKAVLFLLRRGVPALTVSTLPGCGLRGYRFLWMLELLGAVSPKAGGSYPLLLRKRM
jgi:hypothetical protein